MCWSYVANVFQGSYLLENSLLLSNITHLKFRVNLAVHCLELVSFTSHSGNISDISTKHLQKHAQTSRSGGNTSPQSRYLHQKPADPRSNSQKWRQWRYRRYFPVIYSKDSYKKQASICRWDKKGRTIVVVIDSHQIR